jgi:hypothetical protein
MTDLAAIHRGDYLGAISGLFSKGFYINQQNKITRDPIGPDITTPWIYHLRTCKNNCLKWNAIMFTHFNVIPKECFDCYKVVVRPRNIVELIELLKFQKSLPEEIHCKCGIETREYTPALYGGYWYARGLEEGKLRYKQVRASMNYMFGEDFVVYLKRACTEYELTFGASNKWELDPKERAISEWIDNNFDDSVWGYESNNPDFLEIHVMDKWLKFAHSCGDMSYLQLTNGEYLVDAPVTYHGGNNA